jgi:hypothetical protein
MRSATFLAFSGIIKSSRLSGRYFSIHPAIVSPPCCHYAASFKRVSVITPAKELLTMYSVSIASLVSMSSKSHFGILIPIFVMVGFFLLSGCSILMF